MTKKQDNWDRAYGSPTRCEFVKVMGCSICGWDTTHGRPGQSHPIENAHITNGGLSRKADYDQVIPLCWVHHDEFDDGKKTFSAKYDFDPVKRAAEVEQAWQEWEAAA